MSKHVTVWIDHKEARIFHIDPYTIDEATVLAPYTISIISIPWDRKVA